MLGFPYNLLVAKKVATDLNCNVIFTHNVKFQDIESSKLIGKGVAKEGLYLLEDTKSLSELTCGFNSTFVLNNCTLGACKNRSFSC